MQKKKFFFTVKLIMPEFETAFTFIIQSIKVCTLCGLIVFAETKSAQISAEYSLHNKEAAKH